MNQAALHKFMASATTTEDNDLNTLFQLRFSANLTLIKDLYFSLYPEEKYLNSFEKLVSKLPELFDKRPKALKTQDVSRINYGNWYQSEKIVGMQLYVDHFNKDLGGLEKKLEYFEKLGVNFLHVMPITTRPKMESDGGYAVNSYYEVDKKYGTNKDLLSLTKSLRDKNMYLMLDFVANHTSDEFEWAKKAKKGDLKYQNFYHVYPDRTLPDAYEQTLPEIFPTTSPGNFSYDEEMQKWVMTVFNRFQWDLNYSNPEVFFEMLVNLSKMTNLGVDIVRLDALAFMWKKLGTISQNLPEAHKLISLFKLCLQVIAPGVLFLAEAIVAPKEIVKYFGTDTMKGNECEMAYNATLMALLWDAIATKNTSLIYKNLRNLPAKPIESTWINYLRCHDDIGLGFDDRYINEVGWNAKDHRKFLLDYYSQNLEWSPAVGFKFMYNPKTGDGRITGSCASLLGLEKAIEQNNNALIKIAVDKIIMMHGIILTYGGIPLIYAGDEIGTLNDYSFLKDERKKEDNRWVNRPHQDWKTIADLDTNKSHSSIIFFALQNLIRLRKETPVLADNNNLVLYNNTNAHVLVYERTSLKNKGVLVVCNFNDFTQEIDEITLGSYSSKNKVKDLITGKKLRFDNSRLKLSAYQNLWLSIG